MPGKKRTLRKKQFRRKSKKNLRRKSKKNLRRRSSIAGGGMGDVLKSVLPRPNEAVAADAEVKEVNLDKKFTFVKDTEKGSSVNRTLYLVGSQFKRTYARQYGVKSKEQDTHSAALDKLVEALNNTKIIDEIESTPVRALPLAMGMAYVAMENPRKYEDVTIAMREILKLSNRDANRRWNYFMNNIPEFTKMKFPFVRNNGSTKHYLYLDNDGLKFYMTSSWPDINPEDVEYLQTLAKLVSFLNVERETNNNGTGHRLATGKWTVNDLNEIFNENPPSTDLGALAIKKELENLLELSDTSTKEKWALFNTTGVPPRTSEGLPTRPRANAGNQREE